MTEKAKSNGIMKISKDVVGKKSECVKLLIIVACQNVDIHNDIERIYITLFYKTKNMSPNQWLQRH